MYRKINAKILRAVNQQIPQYKELKTVTCHCNYYQSYHRLEKTNYPQKYKTLPYLSNIHYRVHSTQSDQHRQKVVIETSTPKIVIENVDSIKRKDEIERIGRLEMVLSKVEPYVKLARWHSPIGVYLLYWPCAWSIALASVPGTVPPSTTLGTAGLFLVGAGLMRGAGCTINDMWDKDIDSQVERTKSRPLVSGAITQQQAVSFLALQLSLSLGVLLQLNCYSVVLGASSLLLVVTYPLAKRFTNYPQLFLGATFNWGALMGYSAITGTIDPTICLPLYAGSLAWTIVYDTIYAHQDKADDARIGIKSTAITFGEHTKPILYSATLAGGASLLASGAAAGLGAAYVAAVGAFTAHLATQIYTLNVDNPTDCSHKFKSNSWAGGIILLGILAGGYKQYVAGREENSGRSSDAAASCLVNFKK